MRREDLEGRGEERSRQRRGEEEAGGEPGGRHIRNAEAEE